MAATSIEPVTDKNKMDSAEFSQQLSELAKAAARLFDDSPLPVLIRTKARLVYANKRFAELLGFGLPDFMKLAATSQLVTDDRASPLPGYGNSALNGSLYRYTVRQRCGQPLYLQVAGNPITWMGQDAVQETVVSHSCADDIEAEPGFLQSGARRRFFEALDGFSEGFSLYDSNERLVICNKRFLDMYPTLRDVLKPGRSMREILSARVGRGLVPEAAGREEAWIEERLRYLRSPGGSYDVRNDEGRWVHTRQQRTADGGTLVTAIDVTERKMMEDELARHRDHLEDLVRERTERLEQALNKERELNGLQRQFVSMVSHEFRTPLAIIDGTAQRLLRRPEKATQDRLKDALGKIRNSISRLMGLIETVLDAAHLEEGRIKFTADHCAIGDVLKELQQAYLETYPKHRIDADLERLPGHILADERLIRQIFSNLLSNAVKYSPEGTAIHFRGWQEDESVVVSVQDTGLGIPKDEVTRLFERFFRASTSTGIAGTGIGLHLTRHFIDLHGGSIEVESAEGVGSTFTVRLPITAKGPQ
jgi:signal transduction histidine kinase